MKKSFWFKLSKLLLICVLFVMPFSTLKAASKKVIRVGYPVMAGLSMKDEEGNYYGYDYDYLMQVAQYTGWEYEFVEVKGDINEQITTLMDMLKKGEIDLLGDTRYFDSLTQDYDFPSEPYGSSYNVLAVKNDSDLMDIGSLVSKKGLKIGVMKNATTRIKLLREFAATSDIDYEEVTCDGEEDMLAKYDNHEIDVILITDLSLPAEYHSIVNFSPTPFYFITTKGNSEIISDLNQALVNISKINPTLSSTLYNRYFGNNTNEFILNTSEKEYLDKKSEFKVLMCSGASPIRYGVGMDILDKLAKDTGIKFKYTYATTFEDCKKKALSNEYDIVLGLPFELTLSEEMDLHMSEPYLTGNVVLVTNQDVSPSDLENKKQALTPYNVTLYDKNKNLQYYESTEETLDAINRHDADYTYTNDYMYTYFMNKNGYQNLSYFNAADYLRTQYVYGVTKKDDLSLITILNKAIRTQKNEIESYIYKNAYVEKKFDLTTFLLDHIIALGCIAILILLVIIYFIRSYYQKQLQMKKAVELEYKRYQMLSDLSGEISFTYDYINDSMKISAIGLGKLADEEMIYSFTTAIQDTHLYPDIMRVIASYLMQAKDVTCEEETRMLHNGANWYQLSIKIIEDVRNNKSTAIYAIGKVIDIQKAKEEREQLRIKSETDILTGIMNRGAAQDAITCQLENQKGLGALLMIDLDNFKDVNDSYGHLEGDRVLIETAQLLLQIFEGQIVARLGGDEFIIYIHDTSVEDVRNLCRQTLSSIQNLSCMANRDIVLSMSIGIVLTSCSTDFVAMMKLADQMLYEVKRNGRNNYKIYEKCE